MQEQCPCQLKLRQVYRESILSLENKAQLFLFYRLPVLQDRAVS